MIYAGIGFAMMAIFFALTIAGIMELFPISSDYPHIMLITAGLIGGLLYAPVIRGKEWPAKFVAFCVPFLSLHFVAYTTYDNKKLFIGVVLVHSLTWFLSVICLRKHARDYDPKTLVRTPFIKEWYQEEKLKNQVEESIKNYYESQGLTPPSKEPKKAPKLDQPKPPPFMRKKK